MEVYLIRHTKVALAEPTCYGQTDIDVCSTFEEEAEVTKQKLQGIVFDKVFTSPFRRAARLAEYCGFRDAVRDARLKEIWMGDWEMKTFRELPELNIDDWNERFMDIRMPGGESTLDVMKRMESFFEELRTKPYKRVAVFYHGCAILCTRILYGQLPPTAGFREFTDFGGVEIMEI